MRTQEQDLLKLCNCICCVSFSKFSVLMVYSLALHRNCVRQFLTYDAITIRYRRMVQKKFSTFYEEGWQQQHQQEGLPFFMLQLDLQYINGFNGLKLFLARRPTTFIMHRFVILLSSRIFFAFCKIFCQSILCFRIKP